MLVMLPLVGVVVVLDWNYDDNNQTDNCQHSYERQQKRNETSLSVCLSVCLSVFLFVSVCTGICLSLCQGSHFLENYGVSGNFVLTGMSRNFAFATRRAMFFSPSGPCVHRFTPTSLPDRWAMDQSKFNVYLLRAYNQHDLIIMWFMISLLTFTLALFLLLICN